ncbi:unnamed protein product [Amoebophrya sp. A120]|nr:unnamed protein product [Amoebophrya sp. A120]|eukprot:GSA120T00010849001.1
MQLHFTFHFHIGVVSFYLDRQLRSGTSKPNGDNKMPSERTSKMLCQPGMELLYADIAFNDARRPFRDLKHGSSFATLRESLDLTNAEKDRKLQVITEQAAVSFAGCFRQHLIRLTEAQDHLLSSNRDYNGEEKIHRGCPPAVDFEIMTCFLLNCATIDLETDLVQTERGCFFQFGEEELKIEFGPESIRGECVIHHLRCEYDPEEKFCHMYATVTMP